MEIKIYLKDKNKVIERKLTKKMICSIFDLQYMLDKGVWNTIKLNKRDKDIKEFFKVIYFLDDEMHKIEIKNKNLQA